MSRRVNRVNYRQRRDLYLAKIDHRLVEEKLWNEIRRAKTNLALKWIKDSRRGALPVPVSLVLSEYYLQKNSSSK